MTDNKLFNWVQMATGFALLIGLVLVFIELRQAKSLSLAELTSEAYAEAMADFRTIMGENPAPTIAKACYEPETLTPDELVVLNAYYNSKVAQVSRLRVLEEVADFGVPWEEVARQQLIEVMATKTGQLWFEAQVKQDPVMYEIGRELIELNVSCTGFLNSIALLPESIYDS